MLAIPVRHLRPAGESTAREALQYLVARRLAELARQGHLHLYALDGPRAVRAWAGAATYGPGGAVAGTDALGDEDVRRAVTLARQMLAADGVTTT